MRTTAPSRRCRGWATRTCPRRYFCSTRQPACFLGESKEIVDQHVAEQRILEFLDASGEPQTQAQIRESVECVTQIIRAALTSLVTSKRVERSGEGKKGKPEQFSIATTSFLIVIWSMPLGRLKVANRGTLAIRQPPKSKMMGLKYLFLRPSKPQ